MSEFALFEWNCTACDRRISISVIPEGDTVSVSAFSSWCRCGHALSPGEPFEFVHPNTGERTTYIVPGLPSVTEVAQP